MFSAFKKDFHARKTRSNTDSGILFGGAFIRGGGVCTDLYAVSGGVAVLNRAFAL